MKLPKLVLRNVNSEKLEMPPSTLGTILSLDLTDAEGLGLSKVSGEVQSCTGITLQKRNRGMMFILESKDITFHSVRTSEYVTDIQIIVSRYFTQFPLSHDQHRAP